MTTQEAIKILDARSKCIERSVSGADTFCNNKECDNCELNYAQGMIGEQREALNMAVTALGAIDQIRWERDMAIKQLHDLGYGLGEKVKKSSNLIDRQKAIDAILRLTTFASVRELYEYVQEHNLSQMWSSGINDAINAVIAVPPAQPEQRWIPVSERLPERYGWYLCTLKDGRVNCYYWNKKGEWVDNGKKHFFDLYNIRSRYTGEEINPEQEGSVYWTDWVIAWMPLPEPYKEGDSDERS